ncbi:MAG: PD-(D/E)XK nuclease superfamily protein [Candidatus Eremiobacterota bacterium]
MTDKKQGSLATGSGNTLEQTITGTLLSKGFTPVNYGEYIKKKHNYGEELLLKNVPYKTIYGHDGKTEFLLKSRKYSIEVRIECKWQQASGSVDEKYPYLYLNCIEAMPEKDIIIIIDGGGAKEGAVKWLKKAAENHVYTANTIKNIKVFNLVEFVKWANFTFR